jgi:ABC-type uncharacterized transport system permease subunit
MFSVLKGTKIVAICTSLVLLCQPIMHGTEKVDYKNCSKLTSNEKECYECYDHGNNTMHCFSTPEKTFLKKAAVVLISAVGAIGAVHLLLFDIRMLPPIQGLAGQQLVGQGGAVQNAAIADHFPNWVNNGLLIVAGLVGTVYGYGIDD